MSETVETIEIVEKQYQLRALCAKDIFPMSKIINKIGVKEFSKAFQSEEIQKLMQSFQKDTEENKEEDAAILVGVSVAFEIVTIILEKLPDCEQEIYGLLASLSGMTKEEISNLPMDVFMEMVIDVVRKEEFANFIKAVLRLFKSES